MRTELLINRLYANMDTVRQLEADQQSDAAVFARTQKKTIGTGGSPIEKLSIPSR